MYRELQTRLEQLVDAYDKQIEQKTFFKEHLEKLLKETEEQRVKIEELEREPGTNVSDKRVQFLQMEIELLREQLENAQVNRIFNMKNCPQKIFPECL